MSFIIYNLQQNLTLKRAYILTMGGIFLTFGSKIIDCPGAGSLATIIAAFVAALCWMGNDSYSVSII